MLSIYVLSLTKPSALRYTPTGSKISSVLNAAKKFEVYNLSSLNYRKTNSLGHEIPLSLSTEMEFVVIVGEKTLKSKNSLLITTSLTIFERPKFRTRGMFVFSQRSQYA